MQTCESCRWWERDLRYPATGSCQNKEALKLMGKVFGFTDKHFGCNQYAEREVLN